MNDLYVKVIYTPDLKLDIERKFLYKDKTAHVRLRDYGQTSETISGFENKLTFITSVMFYKFIIDNYSKYFNIIDNDFNRETYLSMITDFKESISYKLLREALKKICMNNNELIDEDICLKILPVYHKKNNKYKYYGKLTENVLYLSIITEMIKLSKTLKTVEPESNADIIEQLAELISDDRYEIVFSKVKLNKLKKTYTKYNKLKCRNITENILW